MAAEVALAWPHLLEGRIRLLLVLQVAIIGSQDGVAEARILTYDFRTAGRPRVETESAAFNKSMSS
jgi:hypothetical protein